MQSRSSTHRKSANTARRSVVRSGISRSGCNPYIANAVKTLYVTEDDIKRATTQDRLLQLVQAVSADHGRRESPIRAFSGSATALILS
uniref:Transposase n=1 Tax=Ascaris lumbricoides TaxID=6252 RepID=A0A0M3HW09_ASCLU